MSTNSLKVSRGRVMQARAWEQEQVMDTEKKDTVIPMDLTADEPHQVSNQPTAKMLTSPRSWRISPRPQ